MTARCIPEDITPVRPVAIPDEAVRSKLLELLGLQAIPERVEYTVDSQEMAKDGMTVTRLHFANVLGEVVPGILVEPSVPEKRSLPGVVCLPGTGGTAERLTHERFHRPSPTQGPLVGWARELARRGFVTLSLTLKGCEQRRGHVEQWEREAKLLAPFGRTLMGVQVDEALRGAYMLAAWEGLHPQRIGLTGMSLGGNVTWYAMACATWIRAAVPVCGGVGSLIRAIQEGDPKRHSSYFYIPHLLRFFDHPRIVRTCIVPRPFMVIAPLRDEDMPSTGVDELVRQVTPPYVAAGVAERFRVLRPDTNHVFLPEFFQELVEWFRTHLMP